MMRMLYILSILILLTVSACTLQAPRVEAPTATISITEDPSIAEAAPTDTLVPALEPTFTEIAPPAPTAAAPTAAPPEAYPPPTTLAPKPTAAQPTATRQAPAASPTPATTFDPYTTYGEPSYQNPMEFPNYGEWTEAGESALPNNNKIRLQFKDGQLYVTGKRLDFSTWWFSYHTLSDAFIEMTFNSENCSGEDAYGFILRGAPHKAGISYGYVVAFTCNGNLWVFRLDDADPWTAENLIEVEENGAIHTGADEENVIGVQAEGERLVIYANGVQVAEVEDDHFGKGRVGVFVRSAWPDAYTYRVTNFAYWDFVEEE